MVIFIVHQKLQPLQLFKFMMKNFRCHLKNVCGVHGSFCLFFVCLLVFKIPREGIVQAKMFKDHWPKDEKSSLILARALDGCITSPSLIRIIRITLKVSYLGTSLAVQ